MRTMVARRLFSIRESGELRLLVVGYGFGIAAARLPVTGGGERYERGLSEFELLLTVADLGDWSPCVLRTSASLQRKAS
jgi:hypothetical protein